MAYGFNDDKSKADFGGEWTDIPIAGEVVMSSSKLKYRIGIDGEVTLMGNLDFRASNQGVDAFASLPNEIKPRGANGGGIGVFRESPIMFTHMGHKRIAFELGQGVGDKDILALFLDAVSAGDYIIFEYKYNPTM